MPLLAEINFWNAFWLLIIWIPMLLLWGFSLFDLFNRHDLSGVAKVLWLLLIIWIPVIGVFIYFVARPVDAPSYSPSASEPEDVTGQLEKLADLKDRGAITEEEFSAQKAKLLGTG